MAQAGEATGTVVEARVPIGGKPNSALKETPKAGDGVDPNHPQRALGLSIADREGGVVVGGPRKKIAICGFASSSRDMVPVHDDTWEVWGLNQLYRHIKRADRWFEIHYFWEQEVVPGTDGGYDKEGSYQHWLANCGIPVYMHHTVAEIPTSVRYPLEALIARHGADYFTSTIAFMVVVAIDEIDRRVASDLRARLQAMAANGELADNVPDVQAMTKALYEEYCIGVFGVDLVVGDEYFHQKACAEFWLGQASARGIRVVLPPTTALCKQMYRYGYEKEPETILKISEIDEHSAGLARQREEHLKALYCIDGAVQVNALWKELITLRLRGVDVAPPKLG